jgi:flagellar protein FlgJ
MSKISNQVPPNQVPPNRPNPNQSKLGQAPGGGRVQSKAAHERELQRAAQGMEKIFLHRLIRQMRKTVPKSEMDNNQAHKIYQGMLDEEYAKIWSERGGIGLSDIIVQQLGRNIGVPKKPK